MLPEAELHAALEEAPVTLWWRDDDAGRDAAQLERLLALAERRRVPLALAVVPAWLESSCVRRILACPFATVLQHGIGHADHALPPAKKIELGGRARLEELAEGLAAGGRRLADAFGERHLPVLVPPWNRIEAPVTASLPVLGVAGLSLFGPRTRVSAPRGVVTVNTHLDLVSWREGARSLTLAEAAGRLVELARAAAEPIGILSHHLVMDEAAFATLDRLLGMVQDQAGVRLASAAELFREER